MNFQHIYAILENGFLSICTLRIECSYIRTNREWSITNFEIMWVCYPI